MGEISMSFDDYENNPQGRDEPASPAPESLSGAPEGPETPQEAQDPQDVQDVKDVHEAQDTGEAAPEESREPRPRRQPVQPYGYDEDDRRAMWSEPVYESATADTSDAYSPGRHSYTAGPQEPPAKSGHGFLRALCLVLVCALVSGGVAYAVAGYRLGNLPEGAAGNTVILGSPVSSVPAPSGDSDVAYTGQELTSNEIYRLAQKQVVGVNTNVSVNVFGQTSTRAVSGSGFIISPDGYILTNYHVISYAVVYGGELTVLMNDGARYPAVVKGYVEGNDVAVIKVDVSDLTPVTLGNSDGTQVGDDVYAVGNPLGELAYTMTPGMVCGLDRVITTTDEISGTSTSINMFQISAAVNAGNSGGPVYNSRGEVIGVVTAKYADEGVEGLGFAIPINDAITIAKQLIERGYVASAGLGIMGRNVSVFYKDFAMEYYNIPYGVHVESVNEGSAAEAAGILPGDIITALGERSVASMDELQMALRRYSPGDTETITVYRLGSTLSEGQYLDLTITFEELVQEPADTSTQQQQTPQFPDSWRDFFGD